MAKQFLDDTGVTHLWGKIKGMFATKSDLNSKQNNLVSGGNIKTINGISILGPGDMVISAPQSSYRTLSLRSLGNASRIFTHLYVWGNDFDNSQDLLGFLQDSFDGEIEFCIPCGVNLNSGTGAGLLWYDANNGSTSLVFYRSDTSSLTYLELNPYDDLEAI